jgi:hypothetical protein
MDGLVRNEFILPGQSVTGYFKIQVLQRLCDAVQRNGTAGGKDSGFCTLVMHRATHCLVCSNSLMSKTTSNHHIPGILL